MDRAVKIGAFCRELGDNALRVMAHDDNKEPAYEHAEELLKTGQIGPELEADLRVSCLRQDIALVRVRRGPKLSTGMLSDCSFTFLTLPLRLRKTRW